MVVVWTLGSTVSQNVFQIKSVNGGARAPIFEILSFCVTKYANIFLLLRLLWCTLKISDQFVTIEPIFNSALIFLEMSVTPGLTASSPHQLSSDLVVRAHDNADNTWFRAHCLFLNMHACVSFSLLGP